jgi:hypothetical protein
MGAGPWNTRLSIDRPDAGGDGKAGLSRNSQGLSWDPLSHLQPRSRSPPWYVTRGPIEGATSHGEQPTDFGK